MNDYAILFSLKFLVNRVNIHNNDISFINKLGK